MAKGWWSGIWAPILLFSSSFTSVVICAREVVLLDTTKISRLEWTTYKGGSQDNTNNGWREGSYSAENGNPVRVYASCSVSSQGVDNWLRTPFIPRGEANSLHIEITFSMRRCVKHNDPGSLQQCKETFNLFYYEADSDIANEMMPMWDEISYQSIDKIAADHLYDDNSNLKINKEDREVPLNRGLGGVYFSFQDTGACVTLISIKIYYVMCPNVTLNFAFFMETPTGDSPQALEERKGVCVANAAEDALPTYLCRSDGTWFYAKGSCQCLPGYEGHNSLECIECRAGFYKWELGNHPCSSCPAHSFSTAPKSVECTCEEDFYRSDTDPKSMSCTQPPSAPQNVAVRQYTHNSITVTWRFPMYDGGRNDVMFRIDCQQCDSSVTFTPDKPTFNSTSVILSGLQSSTTYSIRIYSENGVTQASKKPAQYGEDTSTTLSSRPTIINVHVVSVGDSYVTITWEKATEFKDTIQDYQVKWYRRWKGEEKTNSSNVQNFTFRNLLRDTEYSFQVRGYSTVKGWGDFSQPLHVMTGYSGQFNRTTPDRGDETKLDAPLPSIGIIIGSIVAVFLCMAIAAIMIYLLVKRNQNQCNETKGGECDTLHYSHGEVVHCPPLEPHMNVGSTVPLFPPPGSYKTYVDPHTYEDPNQAVREFTREIDASHITIESVIGGGEFGDVCKGKLRKPAHPEMTVAIKTLKPGATDKNRLDFLTEASIMGQFDDPNVIFLEGVVTKSHPIMIVTEYMANGSLDTYLRNNDGKFTIIQLVGMMRGIAAGMRYLSEMGYVHRDLAARNILVNENLVCKVADFGLSREVDIDTTDGAYTTKGGKIPVRWTAPEAIAFRKFTTASDIWSYGVVMWEIISYGERPYWNWSNQDVIRAVEKGYRLPPPMDCPEAIHQLMLDCWQKDRGNRPKFVQIVKSLDKFIRAPELLRKIAKPRPEHLMDAGFSAPEVPQYTNVESWLISIKMEKYIDNFLQAGYRTMDQVATITPKDLEVTLQITLIGHQKKIMNSVQTLRVQMYGLQFPQMSDGFLV
ncbi:ephrin type-B receptor 1-B-like isoform X3 [Mizuhopecten yessoensis]|uniref:ephrin type-B receptor 1-B-like isoform X3 n=1 Tax=Mizuhopecten yessoensis TaxID=6573 RepID=UPI000B45CE08|nr:ephrin type-B receptor 1-B-like isoform X3 [Mizuhopecten yessoensis]